MVDLFTGDFTYNLPLLEVPGPHGSGYPLTLSYHSGVTPEEEASWVGFGWTLNAGAINRATRGLPDDYKAKPVKFYNTMPKNWTATVGGGASFGEVFGKDLASVSGSIRYNNYRGFGYNAGVGISLARGLVSMGYNVSDGTGSFSLNTNPYAVLNFTAVDAKKKLVGSVDHFIEKGFYKHFREREKKSLGANISLVGSSYGVFSYNDVAKPNIVHPYSGKSWNVSVGLTGNPSPVPVGPSANVYGSYTSQTNAAPFSATAYGYMYSANAAADQPTSEGALMDYHVENESDFNPRDVFMGVPFNDADNFMVSGEGIGGAFRLYNKTAGQFGPRAATSSTEIFNVGGDIGAGWTFGPGIDVGKGTSALNVSKWTRDWTILGSPSLPPDLPGFKSENSTEDEPMFFRFNNDLGGEWGDVHDDKAFQASISSANLPTLSAEQSTYNVGGKRSGRSSYIGYNLNSEMMSGSVPSVSAYSRIKEINTMAGRSLSDRGDLIGEIAVFNESGSQYNYGLPVYSRSEKSMNHSVKGLSIPSNYLAYPSSLSTDVQIGEEKTMPYASTYLLTEILTPDYVDHGVITALAVDGEDGASPDDAGGYTRFNYKSIYNSTDTDWYDWRAPYTGLLYNRGSMSDPLDDTGGYSEGEKEIYYLNTIETKTHVAIFYTSTRTDSYEAPANAYSSSATRGTKALERLDKIELWTIQDFQRNANGNLVRTAQGSPVLTVSSTIKPVKTVYFQYDYSLSQSLQNSSGTSGANGKLTLKRVYTQYNGIDKSNGTDVRISPYEFSYAYPDYSTYPADYKSGGLYDVSGGYSALDPAADQNPSYDKFSSDAWGNYQEKVNGLDRFTNMRPWVDQRQKANANHFDPAAWHLKKISLPSGGQIHIQYEQDDYSYVQDQVAHGMVTLKNVATSEGTYVLDLSSLYPVGTTPADITALTSQVYSMIKQRYMVEQKKMYFKILYQLLRDDGNLPNLATCNADFITGYASLSSVNLTSGDIYVTFNSSQRLPKAVCEDFVKSQRLGKVVPGANCSPANGGVSDGSDAKSVVMQLLTMAQNIVVPEMCMRFDAAHSYLRVPIPVKRGGGVRVKRVLTFSTALEGNNVLYGNEYVYKTKVGNNVISSGVATNEPQTIREECVLTDFIARRNQSFASKIIAGRDKDQSEGPIGESVLPGPSVGYSKVVVKNIHNGKSNPGFTINEFFTAKDYPVKLAVPEKAETMTAIKKLTPDRKNVTTPFYTQIINKTLATQGYAFVLNNMHGQARRTASYGGVYDENDETKSTIVNSTTYEYYSPGEKIPVMSSMFGGVTMKNPGREVDITFAQRSVTESQNDTNVEGDLQITIIPLLFIILVIPYPTAIPAFSSIEGDLKTHQTSKVVRYPAIVKKVTTEQDGIKHVEENLAFDDYTGKPVAVRSIDDFKGAYLTQNIPASWEYSAMGGKWKNENKTLVSSSGFYLWPDFSLSVPADDCSIAEFSVGDKILLGNGFVSLFHVVDVDYVTKRLKLESAQGNTQFSSTAFGQVTILRSGRTNQLQAQAGSITVHNETASNLAPITVSQANRYETSATNNFIYDLGVRTANLTGASSFTLAGTYLDMDMSAFASHPALVGCGADLTKVKVRNLEYRYTVTDLPSPTPDQILLELMSFEVECVAGSNTFITVTGDVLN